MNKRFFSTIVSISMMATMIPMSVYADDPYGDVTNFDTDSSGSVTVNGSGLEGHVNKTVFHMVVPTDDTVQETLKFVMDPEGLLEATKEANINNLGGVEITTADSTLFFKNVDGNNIPTGLSNTSSPLTITNKSSVDVMVKVSASLSNIDGIKLATNNTFVESDTDPSLYLAIVNNDDTDNPSAVSSQTPGYIETLLTNAEEQYEVTFDGNDYKYDLVANPDETKFTKLSFSLMGATNPNADWSDLTNTSPKITIVWEFSSDNLKAKYVSKNSISSADETIRIGNGKVISNYQYRRTGYTILNTVSPTQYTLEGNELKIDSSIFEGGTELVLTFEDGTVEIISFVKS